MRLPTRLSVAIQTHQERADLALDLHAKLPGSEVVFDPAPLDAKSPWRCYEHALWLTPRWATHRLIVQDDATPCEGFLAAAELAVDAQPDAAVAFFHAGRPAMNTRLLDNAADRGCPWARLDAQQWVPVVALSWPVVLIEPVLDWVAAQNYPPQFRADDEIVGRAFRELHVPVLATVPSLVEHADMVDSITGMKAWRGEDAGRVAHRFIREGDPALIDWSMPP